MEPLRERPAGCQQFRDQRPPASSKITGLTSRGLERRTQILCGSLVTQQYAEQSLDLEGRRGRFGAEPILQCGTAPRGDRVTSALASAALNHLRVGVPALDEPLELGVQMSLGARPKVMKTSLCLADELISRPGLHPEQTQKREGGRSRRRWHPLTILQHRVVFTPHWSMEASMNDTEYVALVDTDRDELRERIALARNRFDRLVRAADPLARPPGLDWTVQQVVAHVLTLAHRYQHAARGDYRPAAYPREVDVLNQTELEAVMAPVPELADQIQALAPELDSFFDAVSDDRPRFAFHAGAFISGLTGQTNWLGELLLHGHDVARAVKAPWELPERDMLLVARGLMQIAPAYLRAATPADTDVCVAFKVPGARPYLIHIRHDNAEMRERRPDDRPDAVLQLPGSTLTQLLYQRIGPLGAARRGLRIIGGRRPWVALKLQSYFEPV